MRSRHAFALATLLLASPMLAQGTVVLPPPPPLLVVSGRGEVKLKPDRATLSIAVETRAKTASDAAFDNANRQQEVQRALQRLGIAPESISTTLYNIQPDWRTDPTGRENKLVGYVVQNQIAVKVSDLKQLGKLIDAALDAGANRVDGIQFSSSKEEDGQQAALDSAVKQAARRAAVMARAAGGMVGPLYELTTEGNGPIPMMGAADVRTMSFKAETPITPGELTVVVTVLGRWQFVHGGSH